MNAKIIDLGGLVCFLNVTRLLDYFEENKNIFSISNSNCLFFVDLKSFSFSGNIF